MRRSGVVAVDRVLLIHAVSWIFRVENAELDIIFNTKNSILK